MAIPIQIMVKNGNAEIVWLLSLDMVPFVTIRYQIRLPILKQPVLIYHFRPFLQPDLSEISHISTKPGEKQYFWIMKYVANKQFTTYISLPYGKPCHVALIPKTEIGSTLLKTSPWATLSRQITSSPLPVAKPVVGLSQFLYWYMPSICAFQTTGWQPRSIRLPR